MGVLDGQGQWMTHEVKSEDLRWLLRESFYDLFSRSTSGTRTKGHLAHPLTADISALARDGISGDPVQFDQVVFLNDVYFCVRDVLHLMEHEVDMACGMDFYPPQKDSKLRCLAENAGYYDIWVSAVLACVVRDSESEGG